MAIRELTSHSANIILKDLTTYRTDVTRRMDAEGTDVVGGTPQQFAPEVKAEFEKWRGLARKLGLDKQG